MNIKIALNFPEKGPHKLTGPPTDFFATWISQELSRLVPPSESFQRKYGKDWRLYVHFGAHFGTPPGVEEPIVGKPATYRRTKEIELGIMLPWAWYKELGVKDCPKVLEMFFYSLSAVLKRLDLDPSRMLEASRNFIEHVCSKREMLGELGLCEPVSKLPYIIAAPQTSSPSKKATATQKPRKSQKKLAFPAWKIPKNIQKRVADEDGMWEDERFDPILLTVMSDVEYEGRDIPLSWQIEFDPFDDRLETVNEKLESSGIEADGDGWAEAIEKEFAKRYPKLAGELHSDSESSTCVLWVESEKTCQKLIELVWALIHAK